MLQEATNAAWNKSWQAAADVYSGGDKDKFKNDNPDMFRNMQNNVRDNRTVFTVDSSGQLKENWNMGHESAPGTSLPFLSGVEDPKPIPQSTPSSGNKGYTGGDITIKDGVATMSPIHHDGYQQYVPYTPPAPAPAQQQSYAEQTPLPEFKWLVEGSKDGLGLNDNVMSRVNEVMDDNSPLMQRAYQQGMQLANSRGLLNSGLAGELAQNAVIDAALPIGSQEASQNFTANQSYRDYAEANDLQNISLQNSNFQQGRGLDFQRDENQLSRDFQSRENQLNRDFESGENSASRFWQSSENQLGRDFTGSQADLDRLFQQSENELNRDLQLRDLGLRLANEDRAGTANQVYRGDVLYQDGLNAINANPNLSADDRATQITSLNDRYTGFMDLVEQIYDVDLVY